MARRALRRTVRVRFTALYTGLFLGSGALLLALAYAFATGSRRSVSQQVPGTGGTSDQLRQVQAELADAHATQTRQLLLGCLLAFAVMAVLSVLLGTGMARRVLRPLREITAATQAISAANLDRRLAVPGPHDEVKDLADTIDGLLARLEASFAAQRRFVADASHELRTPLTTMRASLDVAVAKPDPAPQTVALAGRLRTELDRVDGLLSGLLVLARAEHGALRERTAVPLAGLVADALADRADQIAVRRLTVTLDGTDDAVGSGDRTLLARLVANLVDNAVVHNAAGGWIRISTAATGAEARLTIATGGAVLDAAQLAELTRPFRRLAADRTGSDTGSGLGLSIVAAIAAAHHGSLDLAAPATGGLTATVRLPRDAA
ncbi:sensor histidine kinase [Actinocatenispora comari]|jgi:signal transduction histidine kinase|uniref:histidine kinase n=1 Tax=Actinocatenispora comari TaxID=2807577 RepID=A0A8J4EJS3_9ACTN|nr:HAMP domain-containing sensor histidine kinase [Actinocatenispora comari]GIL26320.1 two-component sensor histidine kinase [Actinocatenispora comari]